MSSRHPLDHLVFATPDVNETVAFFFDELGVRASAGGKHLGWGTHNALASLGDGRYLEIVGPDPDQPDPEQARPFAIDDLDGPRLMTWAISVPDAAAARLVAIEAGYDPGAANPMTRGTADGGVLRWSLTQPPLGPDGGILPFVIEWGPGTPHPSGTAIGGLTLGAFAAVHPHAEGLNNKLAALGAPLTVRTGPSPCLSAVLRGPHGEYELRS